MKRIMIFILTLVMVLPKFVKVDELTHQESLTSTITY